MEIKILGGGCAKCDRLEKLAREVAGELMLEATFTKVTDVDAIMAYDVMSTPALVIEEDVKASGRIPRRDPAAGHSAWLDAAGGEDAPAWTGNSGGRDRSKHRAFGEGDGGKAANGGAVAGRATGRHRRISPAARERLMQETQVLVRRKDG